jgi:hypothetical protein
VSSFCESPVVSNVADPDPQDPYVFGLPDSDPLVKGTDQDLFIFDVNVASKSRKQKKTKKIRFHLEGH